MELVPTCKCIDGCCMMARVTQVYSIDEVARRIGESLELLEAISWNDDNIDYGEMIRVHNGTDESIVTFTTRGMEAVQEFLAEARTWNGGIRQFLIEDKCEPETIESIMAHEKNA